MPNLAWARRADFACMEYLEERAFAHRTDLFARKQRLPRVVPAHHELFAAGDTPIEHETDNAENRDTGEREIGLLPRRGKKNEIAETLLRGDELAHHDADDCERHGNLHAAEDERG